MKSVLGVKMMVRKNVWQGLACFIVGFMGQAMTDVHASDLSEGCAKLNGHVYSVGTVTGTTTLVGVLDRTYQFSDQDVVAVKVTGTVVSAGQAYLSLGLSLASNQYFKTNITDPVGPFSYQEVIQYKDNLPHILDFIVSSHAPGTILQNVQYHFKCQSRAGLTQNYQTKQVNALQSFSQKSNATLRNLVQKRMKNVWKRQKLSRQKSNFAKTGSSERPKTDNGLALLAMGKGQAAGELQQSSAIWGNAAFTRSRDDHITVQQTSLQGTALGGIDHFILENVLVGGAINLDLGYSEDKQQLTDVMTTSMGISPYISWQFDDVFSLDFLGNISYVNSRLSDRSFDGITSVISEVDGLRWSLSGSGSGFWVAGNWSLLANLGISYGELRAGGTTASDGTLLTSTVNRIGTASLSLQPSYYWQYDQDLALEPYLLTEYQYDFTMQKTITGINDAPHPNDEDQIRLGLGLNLFGSQFYSGNIEASTVLGRDKYSETSVSGSLRVQF